MRNLAGILLPGVLPFQAAVGYAAGEEPTGTVEVRLTDHREAIADFSMLKVRALLVRLHRKWVPKDRAWVTLAGQSQTVDLLQVTGGRSAVLLKGEAPAGDYDGADFKMETLEAKLRRSRPVKVDLELTPVAVSFRVQTRKKAILTLDGKSPSRVEGVLYLPKK